MEALKQSLVVTGVIMSTNCVVSKSSECLYKLYDKYKGKDVSFFENDDYTLHMITHGVYYTGTTFVVLVVLDHLKFIKLN